MNKIPTFGESKMTRDNALELALDMMNKIEAIYLATPEGRKVTQAHKALYEVYNLVCDFSQQYEEMEAGDE